jgi:hypothetical protein
MVLTQINSLAISTQNGSAVTKINTKYTISYYEKSTTYSSSSLSLLLVLFVKFKIQSRIQIYKNLFHHISKIISNKFMSILD